MFGNVYWHTSEKVYLSLKINIIPNISYKSKYFLTHKLKHYYHPKYVNLQLISQLLLSQLDSWLLNSSTGPSLVHRPIFSWGREFLRNLSSLLAPQTDDSVGNSLPVSLIRNRTGPNVVLSSLTNVDPKSLCSQGLCYSDNIGYSFPSFSWSLLSINGLYSGTDFVLVLSLIFTIYQWSYFVHELEMSQGQTSVPWLRPKGAQYLPP